MVPSPLFPLYLCISDPAFLSFYPQASVSNVISVSLALFPPSHMSRNHISSPLFLQTSVPSALWPSSLPVRSSFPSASCRRGKTESVVFPSGTLKRSASQGRVTPTMRPFEKSSGSSRFIFRTSHGSSRSSPRIRHKRSRGAD